MALSHSPSIVTDGLVVYLDAANQKSYPRTGTGWFDLSSRNNTASLINGVTFNSIRGGAITFDGQDDYSLFSDTSVGSFSNATFSYGAWFYYTGSSQNGYIIAKRNPSSPLNQYNLAINGSAQGGGNGTKVTTFLNPDNGGVSEYASLEYDLGSNSGWYNVTITVNTNEQIMYVNGVNVSSTTKNYSVAPKNTFQISGRNLYIAALDVGSPAFLFQSSYIAVVFLYNKTLNSSEILQNFNALRGRFGI